MPQPQRYLVPSAALLWGLHFAFLSPALALILTSLYGASTADVGWVLSVNNIGGLIASLVIPAWADRRHDYLRPLIGCGALTIALVAVLASVTALPLVTIALVALGGPASCGISLLFAHLAHSGARTAQVVNTRAIVSVAWVAGPPLATFIIGTLGARAILVAIGAVALANIGVTVLMLRRGRAQATDDGSPTRAAERSGAGAGRGAIALIVAGFVLLQATNATSMSFLAVYVPRTLGIDVLWAGAALGLAAALEVPAMLLVGRLADRVSTLPLVLSGAVAAVAYFAGLTVVTGPVMLLALQVLAAWAVAGMSGAGMALFQQLIARPGLSTGMFMNTRRVGAILTGPLIALGSVTPMGERGIFAASAVLTAAALAIIALAARGAAGREVRG